MPILDTVSITDDDYDYLESVLSGFQNENAMNLEMVDGFFVALICSPQLVIPSQYLPDILGETEGEPDGAYDSIEQAEQFMSILMVHWNHIVYTFREREVYLPLLLEDENGNVFGNDWAQGFLRGMEFYPEDWAELLDDDEHGGALVAIFALAHEHDPDSEMRPYDKPMDDDQREQLLVGLAAGAKIIYDYFEPHRQMDAQLKDADSTYRRENPKIGRNAPCPCGSGKKYKQCCGKATLH
ncbi:MAG: UPF0149 family protein [Arenicellales bacterium]|jgi:uncharacterized protein